MSLYYTGIGNRQTPKKYLDIMYDFAVDLSNKGYILRSGNARGADTAFADGCNSVNGKSEIYLPFKNFNGGCKNQIVISDKTKNSQALDLAKSVKPDSYIWSNKNIPFHTRNVYQILGYNLNLKSKFVLCYTATGAQSHDDVIRFNDNSGTSTAISLASKFNIPVINMYNDNFMDRYEQLILIN